MTAGVLVVDKPQGPTSHDIVAVARRALGERRIGHCGTLDPLATGVLVLAVGQATRLVQFLAADEKQYEAAIRFGRTTTTYDVMGETTSVSAARPTPAALDAALARFRGPGLQTPPIFSAKNVDGARAYDLARRAPTADVVLAPVAVTVYALDLMGFDGEVATLSMRVSSGFYVRALAHDLGQALGMGATLESLRRTRSGRFTLADAVSVDTLATSGADVLATRLVPPGRLMPQLPSVRLSHEEAARIRRGLDLPVPGPWTHTPALTRLLDEGGELVAMAIPAKRAGFLHPSVVLG